MTPRKGDIVTAISEAGVVTGAISAISTASGAKLYRVCDHWFLPGGLRSVDYGPR